MVYVIFAETFVPLYILPISNAVISTSSPDKIDTPIHARHQFVTLNYIRSACTLIQVMESAGVTSRYIIVTLHPQLCAEVTSRYIIVTLRP